MSHFADNGGMGGEYAYRLGGIPITLIASGVARKRPLDKESVKRLKQSILDQGQVLQHIGLRATRGLDGGPFELIYGAHRVQAIKELFEEGKRKGNSVPAVIYTANTPEWFIEMAEVAENLVRKELNASERAAHTLLYAALAKQSGKYATASEKNANGGVVSGKSRGSLKSVTSGDTLQKPTVIDAVSKGLGISKKQVHERVNKAAASIGLKGLSIEKSSAKELIDAGRKAVAAAPEAHKARWDKNAKAMSDGRKSRADARQIPSTVLDEDDGYDLAAVEMSEAIDEVLTLFKTMEKRHGEGVIKEAINRWWKKKHPQGRVPFQTTSK